LGSDVLLGRERRALARRGVSVSYNAGFHSKMISFLAEEAERHYFGRTCLVLGPSEGGEQEMRLGKFFGSVLCVDASARVLSTLRKKCPGYSYQTALFEELELGEKFDTIILMHVLEHVRDPVSVLKRIARHLSPKGKLILAVPNALSFHRLLGAEMGLLKTPYSLNASDRKVGHRRVYDKKTAVRDLEKAGLSVLVSKGIFFKPFGNSQMESLEGAQIRGLFLIGEKFPENCAELFFVASIKKK